MKTRDTQDYEKSCLTCPTYQGAQGTLPCTRCAHQNNTTHTPWNPIFKGALSFLQCPSLQSLCFCRVTPYCKECSVPLLYFGLFTLLYYFTLHCKDIISYTIIFLFLIVISIISMLEVNGWTIYHSSQLEQRKIYGKIERKCKNVKGSI